MKVLIACEESQEDCTPALYTLGCFWRAVVHGGKEASQLAI